MIEKHEQLARAEFVEGLIIWKSQFNRATSDTILEFKFRLSDFLRTSTYLTKFAKGNAEKLRGAVEEAKKQLKKRDEESISLSTIYDCLNVTERFPTEEKLITALSRKNLPLNWSGALQAIGRRIEDSKAVQKNFCKKCPIHCL